MACGQGGLCEGMKDAQGASIESYALCSRVPEQDGDSIVRERAAGTMEYIAVKEVGSKDITQASGAPREARI